MATERCKHVFLPNIPNTGTKMTSPLRVAIAGLGVVGGGVAKLLAKNAVTVTKRTGGRPVELVAFASGSSRSESQLREDFGEALHGSQFSRIQWLWPGVKLLI